MAGVTLSAGVRANLLSLQGTSDLKELTQGRLATGKKVNSALDNPNSFFTSSALANRASDLGNLLNSIGQGVQTLKAADQGISSITKLVESAKAKINQALSTTDATSRSNYSREYNEILKQARDVARDSGYNGTNLLAGSGNDLKIAFNEKGTSSLTVSSVDFSATGALGLADLSAATIPGSVTVMLSGVTNGASPIGGSTINGKTFTGSSQMRTPFQTSTTSTTINDYMAELGFAGLTATLDGPTSMTITNNTGSAIVVEDDTTGGFTPTFTVPASTQGAPTTATFEAALDKLNTALSTLRDQASTFGTNLQIVQNRQDFTKSFIDVLQVGADKLTLADTNEEGANLLALNTRQSLSTTSLSFASQADQAVLQFLR